MDVPVFLHLIVCRPEKRQKIEMLTGHDQRSLLVLIKSCTLTRLGVLFVFQALVLMSDDDTGFMDLHLRRNLSII